MFGPVTTQTRARSLETQIAGDAALAGIEERVVRPSTASRVDGRGQVQPRSTVVSGQGSDIASTMLRTIEDGGQYGRRLGSVADAVERHARAEPPRR